MNFSSHTKGKRITINWGNDENTLSFTGMILKKKKNPADWKTCLDSTMIIKVIIKLRNNRKNVSTNDYQGDHKA